jgi:hypothetical protein
MPKSPSNSRMPTPGLISGPTATVASLTATASTISDAMASACPFPMTRALLRARAQRQRETSLQQWGIAALFAQSGW